VFLLALTVHKDERISRNKEYILTDFIYYLVYKHIMSISNNQMKSNIEGLGRNTFMNRLLPFLPRLRDGPSSGPPQIGF
jgi:hypothetical protein